jgi:type II secretory pathway pseudopilin PulG
MIALAILGIALIPASYIFTTSNRKVVRGQALLDATMVAESLMDQVCYDRFIMSNVGRTITIPDDNFPQLKILPYFAEKFSATASITFEEEPTYFNQRNLRRVKVSVEWKEGDRELSTSLETLKANINDILLPLK